jgi:hypothetical protein
MQLNETMFFSHVYSLLPAASVELNHAGVQCSHWTFSYSFQWSCGCNVSALELQCVPLNVEPTMTACCHTSRKSVMTWNSHCMLVSGFWVVRHCVGTCNKLFPEPHGHYKRGWNTAVLVYAQWLSALHNALCSFKIWWVSIRHRIYNNIISAYFGIRFNAHACIEHASLHKVLWITRFSLLLDLLNSTHTQHTANPPPMWILLYAW